MSYPQSREKFDRLTWDISQYLSPQERAVSKLRNAGFGRACKLRRFEESGFKDAAPNKFWKYRSTAFEETIHCGKKGVFVDAGSGFSPDSEIALMEGYKKAYALDLFPWVSAAGEGKGVISLKQDICEQWKFCEPESIDTIVCQAVLPLMNKIDRTHFYNRASMALKQGGHLSVYFCTLVNEHPWNIPEERETALKYWFGIYRNFPGGFVLERL